MLAFRIWYHADGLNVKKIHFLLHETNRYNLLKWQTNKKCTIYLFVLNNLNSKTTKIVYYFIY